MTLTLVTLTKSALPLALPPYQDSRALLENFIDMKNFIDRDVEL